MLAHNDLNLTNFLKDDKNQFHLIDWECGGLNYPGYEIANFFSELKWDYTYNEEPYFRVNPNNGLSKPEIEEFLSI